MNDGFDAIDMEALLREIQLYLAVVAASRECAGDGSTGRDSAVDRRDQRREEM